MYAGRDRRAGAGRARCSTSRSIRTRVGLLGSIPRLDVRAGAAARRSKARCRIRCGARPAAASPPRCPFADARCRARRRRCARSARGHRSACWQRAARRRRAGRARRRRRDGGAMSEPTHRCCRSSGLVKHFPVRRGLFGARARARCARSTASTSSIARRRDAGRGRRIGLRQVDARRGCVLRLIEPTAGRVAFDGSDLGALDAAATARAAARACRSSSRTRTRRSTRA